MLLYQILTSIIHKKVKNIKKLYKNNRFKTSAPTWNDKFELPDWSNSVSDTQDYLEYIIKKHQISEYK